MVITYGMARVAFEYYERSSAAAGEVSRPFHVWRRIVSDDQIAEMCRLYRLVPDESRVCPHVSCPEQRCSFETAEAAGRRLARRRIREAEAAAGRKFLIRYADGTEPPPEAQYVILRIDGDGPKRRAARWAVLDFAAKIAEVDEEQARILRSIVELHLAVKVE